jgi:hypothetical protein
LSDEPKEKESEETKEEEPGLNCPQLLEMRQLCGIWPTSAAAKLAESVGTRTTRSMTSGRTDTTPLDDAFETAHAAIKKLFDDGDFGYNYAMFVQDPAVEAEEPKNYAHAWNCPDEGQPGKWCDTITKEFLNMEKRKVWKKIKGKVIPAGRRCVKDKWVWNIKRNGVFVRAWWRVVTVKSLKLTTTKTLYR